MFKSHCQKKKKKIRLQLLEAKQTSRLRGRSRSSQVEPSLHWPGFSPQKLEQNELVSAVQIDTKHKTKTFTNLTKIRSVDVLNIY